MGKGGGGRWRTPPKGKPIYLFWQLSQLAFKEPCRSLWACNDGWKQLPASLTSLPYPIFFVKIIPLIETATRFCAFWTCAFTTQWRGWMNGPSRSELLSQTAAALQEQASQALVFHTTLFHLKTLNWRCQGLNQGVPPFACQAPAWLLRYPHRKLLDAPNLTRGPSRAVLDWQQISG